MHWLYFTPLRRRAAAWSNVIIYTSLAGTVLCLAGIIWGAWRLSPLHGYRLRDHRQWSPYSSWMRFISSAMRAGLLPRSWRWL